MKNNNKRNTVFISYVKDNLSDVKKICKAFTDNNIDYWLDKGNIDPGKFWKDAIKIAINNGAYFLACFSKEYNAREETYMNEELLEAAKILRTKGYDSGWFIPIKLSECETPPLDLGAGKTLQDIHYLSFYEDWDAEYNRLIDIIKREDDSSSKTTSDEILKKQYTYRGLKSLIESGNGTGFHNADLRHPVYVIGANELNDSGWEYADSPEKNLLFKMLSKLSKELKQSGIEDNGFAWWYDFSEWKDFCKFAVGVYKKKRDYK